MSRSARAREALQAGPPSLWGAVIRRALGALLILTAIAVSLSRAPDRTMESLVARWAPPPSDFVDVLGQVVHVRDEGPRHDPRPLVLLHGTSSSLHTWDGWTQALRGQRRVIRFDLPGFGLTGPWSEQLRLTPPYADYNAAALARFTLAVLDALQVREAVLVGNSLGGEVAWHAALLAPERVQQLVLVDSAGLPMSRSQWPVAWQFARSPLGIVGDALLPRELVVQGVHLAYGDLARVSPALVDRYYELTLREGNRAALRTRLRAFEPGRDAQRLAEIRQPTLVLWGERDRLLPVAMAAGFQQRIPGSRVVVLPALGHVPQEEDPAASLSPVKAFLGLR